MRFNRTLAILALAASACASQAATTVYTAKLSGAAEAPPNSSLGTGDATVTIDDAFLTMRVEVTFSGLSGNTTAAHIHCCTTVAGTGTAGVATVTPNFTGFPTGVKSGAYDHTFDMALASSYNAAFITAKGGTVPSSFAALVAGLNAGTAYLNIHTSVFPSGEIRGFLGVPSAVPEPATYAMMGLGLAVLGASARRRRG